MDDMFDVNIWIGKLTVLVDEITSRGNVEDAIKALETFDIQRKRIDRIQAFPQYGAPSEVIDWKRIDPTFIEAHEMLSYGDRQKTFRVIVKAPHRNDLFILVYLTEIASDLKAEIYSNGIVDTIRLIGYNRVLATAFKECL